MIITTHDDLTAYVTDVLIAMGVEAERETISDSVRKHRVERCEDHDDRALDALIMAVWSDVTDGADWPL